MLIHGDDMDTAASLHTRSCESNASTWRNVGLITNPCTVSSRSSKSSQPESVIIIDVHENSITSTLRSITTSMTSALAPLTYVMRACGLMHVRHRACRVSPSMAYALIVVLCLILNFARLFLGYTAEHRFPRELFGRITIHIWTFTSAVGAITCYMLSERFPTIARKWNEIAPLNESKSYRSLRRWSVACTVFCAILFLGTATVTLIYVSCLKTQYPEIAHLYFHKENPSIAFTIFYVFSVLFTEVAWSLPLCAFFIIVLSLIKLYQDNLRELRKTVDPDGCIIGCIGEIRQRHEHICKAVRIADNSLSLYCFTIYATQFPLLCYAVHNVVRGGLQDGALGGQFLVMFFSIFHLSVVTGMGCSLQKSATAHRAVLYEVKLSGSAVDMAELTEYNTFLKRVTDGNLGLSALKLFYINNKTVLMMILIFAGFVTALLCTQAQHELATARAPPVTAAMLLPHTVSPLPSHEVFMTK